MSSIEYNEKLKDPRWQRRRLKIFERDNWTCQLCSRTDLELHVHHLFRTTEDPWDEPDLHLVPTENFV
jgi:5-methylcytosine-specific restriction endonuclease McrA